MSIFGSPWTLRFYNNFAVAIKCVPSQTRHKILSFNVVIRKSECSEVIFLVNNGNEFTKANKNELNYLPPNVHQYALELIFISLVFEIIFVSIN